MSQNNMNMNDDLLVKYLVGETDADENAAVEFWLKADEKNRNYYNGFKKIWEDSLLIAAENKTIDEDAAWKRLQNRIHDKEVKVLTPKKSSVYWLRIAASILLISTLGWLGYSYFENKSNTLIQIYASNSTLNDTLPDGTTVTLNKNSSLSYASKFKGKTRPVTLKGEAFFNVSPNKTKPFIITINDVTVQVVGTSFNVKNKNGKTTVDVETGIVKVSKNKDQVELRHGEKVVIADKNSELLKSTSKGRLYNYYRNKELVCDETPLQDLVEALNEIYDVNIIIKNPSLKEKPLTTVFKDQSLDQVLEVIQETFRIEIERKNNQIILE
ncbi:ferric-dicitrate binding protein FerR (iron transport regulator) [Flavobacterium sp. 2755]|uniref:FecR domain-containing protein n=1 Tax=Flavobacterium sp. 2755 TaxID=2817765 RepID=UPI0028563A57|nr:FecR domain-containing protein [Flavobacterium sp. 2755]MDR6759842.1 ferric-dicitrate binding protein FerR (iron transport regulator) [Flavobacterium sp. 2755]